MPRRPPYRRQFICEGQPEALKYELAGLWSRRINREHRIIYRVEEEIVTVYVISAFGHAY